MATEVKHGPNPTFDAEIRGEFSLTLVGHSSTTPSLAAGGVRPSSTTPVRTASAAPRCSRCARSSSSGGSPSGSRAAVYSRRP